jgi:hypothetical protein
MAHLRDSLFQQLDFQLVLRAQSRGRMELTAHAGIVGTDVLFHTLHIRRGGFQACVDLAALIDVRPQLGIDKSGSRDLDRDQNPEGPQESFHLKHRVPTGWNLPARSAWDVRRLGSLSRSSTGENVRRARLRRQ